MHLVTPQIAIGSHDDAANPQLLQQFGIDAVLSLEPVRLIGPAACQMTLQVKDRIALPAAAIEQAVDFIHQQVLLGRRVMAHCQIGISRSPALVLAYLHQYQGVIAGAGAGVMKLCRFVHPRTANGGQPDTIEFGVADPDQQCIQTDQRSYRFDDMALLPPVQPGKIICVGLNYTGHQDDGQTGRLYSA